MKLLTPVSQRLGLFAFVLATNVCALAANQDATLSINALISDKAGLGCEMTLPESVLQFTPLQANKLTGTIQTYQIKPLIVKLSCVDETEALKPTLTLQGRTPYAGDTQQAVFLDETPNGVGFMVRQSLDDQPIALADFYRPDEAIGNEGKGQSLTVLNNDNQYQTETRLWVGVVGPLQPEIIPGHFHASLTLNVAFQ
ncbi:fimbrial protein [Providencia burhodogranariea]|uniref:Putative fimbrial-like protein n=1 Tax=Providencia burhodogranariea DSM 19968 TaxID=1141662 RepID=K8WXB9_9GAMM|nr:fimbrial protein [Providencia burhodogranariea]EKT62037.1 putative fimbrial-like protein [Providencia burhodogranariea DSM 19968]